MTPPPSVATHARIGMPALWFGLFGAAVAWTVQELVGYAILGHACYPSWYPRYPQGGPAVSSAWVAAAVVSAAAIVVGAAAGLTALRSWRRTRPGHDRAEAHHLEVGEGRIRFMALSGIIVSSILFANIVMNALVLFLAPPCG